MLALIDADILLYRIGYTTENVGPDLAKIRMDEAIDGILTDLSTEEYRLYVSPMKAMTFRHEIFPDYKAKRTQPKPLYFHVLRDYLFEEHPTICAQEEEADDAIGQASGALSEGYWKALENHVLPLTEEPIVVSIDKDLDQIEGWHYNFVKQKTYHISPLEGLGHFYQQLLIGDSVDNIPGVRGIGPVKAAKLIAPATTELLMYEVVKDLYPSAELLKRTADLLWIRKHNRKEWFPPTNDSAGEANA